MGKNFWFKHRNDFANDKRVLLLIAKEGAKGYGTYMYIIELLHMQPDLKLSLAQLKTLQRKGFSSAYMKKIVCGSGLFSLDEGQFESVIEFESGKARTEKEKGSAKDRSQPINGRKTDGYLSDVRRTVDEPSTNGGETPDKTRKCEKTDKPLINRAFTEKTPLAPAREDKSRVDKNRKIDVVDGKNAAGAFGEPKLTPAACRTWSELVDSLSANTVFRELVCMRCGYSVLLNTYFDIALQEFKTHIRLHGKEEKMTSMEDVCSYFTNYTRAGQRTSDRLKETLLAHDAKLQPTPTVADNPYLHEQIVDGRRFCLGFPIPDEAPPRPDKNAVWNDELKVWMTHKKFKPKSDRKLVQ